MGIRQRAQCLNEQISVEIGLKDAALETPNRYFSSRRSAIRTIFYYFHLRMNAYKIGRRFLEKVFRTYRTRKNLRNCQNRPLRVLIRGIEKSSVNWIQLGTRTSTLRTISQSFCGVGF